MVAVVVLAVIAQTHRFLLALQQTTRSRSALAVQVVLVATRALKATTACFQRLHQLAAVKVAHTTSMVRTAVQAVAAG
jgi:hypothetical protein